MHGRLHPAKLYKSSSEFQQISTNMTSVLHEHHASRWQTPGSYAGAQSQMTNDRRSLNNSMPCFNCSTKLCFIDLSIRII